jgi:hypothetical protein
MAAAFGLVMIGNPGSEVNVSCSVPVVLLLPSVIAIVTRKLPSWIGVPEITPLAASIVRPGGRPPALTLAAGLVPLAKIWKLKG